MQALVLIAMMGVLMLVLPLPHKLLENGSRARRFQSRQRNWSVA
jgi:hypothetical protein